MRTAVSEPVVEPSPAARDGIKDWAVGRGRGHTLSVGIREAVREGFLMAVLDEYTGKYATWLTPAGREYATQRGWVK